MKGRKNNRIWMTALTAGTIFALAGWTVFAHHGVDGHDCDYPQDECELIYASASAPVDEPLIASAGYSVALFDAGVDEEDAERLYTKREIEDREDVVEVEFYYQDNEYEYTIRCEDGMILEWQVEGRNVNDAQAELSLQRADEADDTDETPGSAVITADGTTLIGLEAAKQIVADEAGSGDLEFAKIHFELDGRYYEYEFEFYEGRREYECTVDAQTGEVIRMEMDD